MSEAQKRTDKSVQETELQTPVSKVATPVCPPAPVKGDLAKSTEVSQRTSLTRSQTQELRKSWKNLSDEIFKRRLREPAQ